MVPLDIVGAFFAASVLLALAPGPDNIFVLTQSALHGKVPGLFVTLGLCTGLIFHTGAVAFGVAAIFQASAMAFNGIKIFGACYLVYLAWLSFRASAASISSRNQNGLSLPRLYLRGIVMNVTNPKVSIFFLAFLPQFAEPGRGALTLQLVVLGAVFIVATVLVFGSVALLAGTIGSWLTRSPQAQLVMNKVAGVVFVGLALKLVTTRR
jgi:threonine/homoserine/homoserine lactone efflux protein